MESKILLRRIICYFIVLTAMVLTGCSPTNKYVRTAPGYENSVGKIDKVTIVSDACLAVDTFGSGNYFSIKESVEAESYMLQAAATYLAGKGYLVKGKLSPFACGFKDKDLKFKIADDRGLDVKDASPPFSISKELEGDKEYREALLNIVRTLQPLSERMQNNSNEFTLSGANIDISLKIVSDRLKSDTAIIMIGNGTVVPAGKQITQALGTAILTLGMVSVRNVSYVDSWITILDLKSGSVLWSNSMRLKYMENTDTFFEKWANIMLYHLPGKK
jgi:hypothetical protein